MEESPPPPDEGRIVEGRPPLYSFKRNLHPLTWVELGMKPLFRLQDNERINRLATAPASDKRAGVKFGVDGTSPGSGLGPVVTFFHKDLFGKGIEVEAPLVYTYNRYELYRLNAKVPLAKETFVDRLTFDLGTAYRTQANDEMFPIGNESPLSAESHIRTVSREASAGFTVNLNKEWKAGLHETYRSIGVSHPLKGTSAQTELHDFPIPGLFSGGHIRSTILSIDHDDRDDQTLPSTGGLQHFEAGMNDDVSSRGWAYWKYRIDVQRFFKLTADRRTVIALRGLAETNQRKSGGDIPWFEMPSLGAWETLRGFENYRFRDASALSLTAEYRYRIWRAMDWGFFLDEGQVARQPGDFGFDRFHTGYGVRLFVFPKPQFPISIDLAHSLEKWRLYVNFNTRF